MDGCYTQLVCYATKLIGQQGRDLTAVMGLMVEEVHEQVEKAPPRGYALPHSRPRGLNVFFGHGMVQQQRSLNS